MTVQSKEEGEKEEKDSTSWKLRIKGNGVPYIIKVHGKCTLLNLEYILLNIAFLVSNIIEWWLVQRLGGRIYGDFYKISP
jgi:hypothetical protein